MPSILRAGPRAVGLFLMLAGLPGPGVAADATAGSTVAPLIERLGLEDSAMPVREATGGTRPSSSGRRGWS